MPAKRHEFAVAVLSCALLVVQVSFTRLISYKLFYHFVFLAIALTLLGLGAAGTFVALRTRRPSVDDTARTWLAGFALLVPVAFVMISHPLMTTTTQVLAIKLIGRDAMLYLLWSAVPIVALNFVGGVVLTEMFREYSHAMGRLYGRDLLGAGAGCLLAVALMKFFSPPTAFLAAALLAVVAVAPFHLGRYSDPTRPGPALAILGAILALALAAGPAPLRDFPGARTAEGRPTLRILKHEWNHIIRTDHAQAADDPRSSGLYVLDGEASTLVMAWDGGGLPAVDPAYVLAGSPPDVAIIGFGGGLQVLEARRARAARITAIEINPTIARWVLNEDRDLNRGLFAAPHIQVVVGEGRHTIRSAGRRYDVIVMHAIDTYAASAAGAYSLTENFLYTEEAFLDFLNAMKDGGVLSIQRWLFNPPRENLRLFVTALEALERFGVADPAQHVVMIAPIHDFELLRTRQERIWGYLLVSPTPFRPEQIRRVREHVALLRGTVLYAPGGTEDTYFSRYVHSADRAAFRAGYPFVIAPVTDARPYLFQFYSPFRKSAYVASPDGIVSGIYQSSAVLLIVALVLSVSLTVALILVPLLWARRASRRGGPRAATLGMRELVYFGALGVGYMALEVPVTQILALYLGHPVYGFAVVLVALLVSSGIGSLLMDRLSLGRAQACSLVAGLLALLTLGIFPLVHGTIGMAAPLRFSVAVAVVSLCGLPMGLPMAMGIRELGRKNPLDVAWAWGVNAAASVVGSCVIMIAMVFGGTHYALATAAACYALAAWTGRSPAAQRVGAAEPSGRDVQAAQEAAEA